MKYLLLSLLLITQVALAAEPLGRLFTSPAEREVLNRLRQNLKGQMLEQAANPLPESSAEQLPVRNIPQEVSIQGFVQRSDGGKGTVWVNRQPLQESSDNGQVQVGKFKKGSNSVPLTMQDNGHHIQLKAGQVFHPETGEITERNVHATEPAEPTASAPLNTTTQGVIR
ncbi:hypothetical protein LG198_05020 [Methylobacillus arboreus]|uniref:hypothetical protein n=1 Tax=Methylobacillus arboreus TaxID=755170 RepID=UPI001E4F8344|nr:hypothetical protein [Methylobacillus arboreus]MCB5190084.1 hypothetical protein [Methylobacillus arboreus]